MATGVPTRHVEVGKQSIMNPNSVVNSDEQNYILDESWAKTAFLISDSELGDTSDIQNRYWSSASAKFTDGRLGCNIGINPKPQFTRYSDIRAHGRMAKRNPVTLTNTDGNYGMGRYYSEGIDDPSQTIYLRFGVPQFNSVMAFLANAYDSDMTALARTGRSSSAFYKFGKAVGTITTVVAFPMLAATVFLGKAVSWLMGRSTSKFYTLKPTMHTYWGTVNNLVMAYAVTRGIFPKIINDTFGENSKGQRLGQPYMVDQDQLNKLAELMPDVFGGSSRTTEGKIDSDNTFDMYALANKAQRIANRVFTEDMEKLNNGTPTDYEGYLKRNMTGDGTHTTYIAGADGKPSWASYFNKVIMSETGRNDKKENSLEQDPRNNPNSTDPRLKKEEGWFEKFQQWGGDIGTWQESFAENMDAEYRDGAQFAIFKVNHTGNLSDSFGNSVMESDLSQKINGISSTMKQARFTFGEGNIVGGVVGDVVGSIAGAASDLVMGTLDGITMGFSNILKGLGGSGYIDIPKHWQSSSAQLARSTYTMELNSPYGNVVSQIQNLFIPLAMIMAGSLPLSTGKQSYTSPFLCQLFDRGRCQIKLGMIESLTVERGTSNLAFNNVGNVMAIKVTFTVVDLSSIIHMPISNDSMFSVDMTMDEDNILTDYLAVLAGQDLYSQIYAMPKAKLRMAKFIQGTSKFNSPAYWASSVHESMKTGTLNTLTLGASGVYVDVVEGLTRGSALSASSVN
jgi:hypothetical protein